VDPQYGIYFVALFLASRNWRCLIDSLENVCIAAIIKNPSVKYAKMDLN
jgi:hypothetical protein